MNSPLFLSLLMAGVLAAQPSRAEEFVEPGASLSAQPSKAVENESLLNDFFDPEMKFAEGCGCYLKRSGATASDGLVFFGKRGDQRESGWVSLRGKIMEVSKEKPDVRRIENGKNVYTQSYRSPNLTIRVKLIEQQLKEEEESGTYTGELTVVSGGRTEKIKVSGVCGC